MIKRFEDKRGGVPNPAQVEKLYQWVTFLVFLQQIPKKAKGVLQFSF